MDLTSIAVGGLQRAESAVDRAAGRLARTVEPGPAPADAVDLSTTAVELLWARTEFALQVRVARMADRMEREALNILA